MLQSKENVIYFLYEKSKVRISSRKMIVAFIFFVHMGLLFVFDHVTVFVKNKFYALFCVQIIFYYFFRKLKRQLGARSRRCWYGFT